MRERDGCSSEKIEKGQREKERMNDGTRERGGVVACRW